MKELERLRKEIDTIDEELTKLFEKRMKTVLKVAQYKKNNSIPILNKNREDEVVEKNIHHLENKSFKGALGEFLKSTMSISRKLQSKELFQYNSYLKDNQLKFSARSPKKEKIKIGFQGVKGSFSEQALLEYFREDIPTYNVENFEDVFEALKKDEIDYGVLPIENSSTGGIAEIYDLLREYGFFIVGERIIKVDHNLLGIKGSKIEDIKEAYSHSQAFSQSSEFLKNYPEWKCIPYKNTATSAELIKNENCKHKVAIGSKKAAEVYGLNIIKPNINHNKNNYTRFIIIGKNLELEDDYNKISILFTLPHKAGSLYNILSIFAENNLSMLKIESRPIVGRSWEYFFYIDFEGNLNDEVVKDAIELIKNNSCDFKLLGNYKAHNNG
ncbi:prephenate dehydratase [Clostridium ganghwense]|uniref:Bifunctional chorismate mutase/prephenate dehydratase n=1 Tax=Clostridium ganghwense TaxID=312089 RepID=A0ABT4CLR4_9CLOT|nr:prephenate dehydratase [Clostridium ganghwense]MCY6369990.1 prephenate dehydratase [Clostridium ganghwense]